MLEEKTFYVYIIASRSHNIYIGITSEIEVRARQHREHRNKGYTDEYNCERLVYLERFNHPGEAIARETQLKKWRREKKLALIDEQNPTWQDLSAAWGRPVELYQWPDAKSEPKARTTAGSSTAPSR